MFKPTQSQQKAFRKVDREFLYKIIKKLGYSETLNSFIKKIYKNTQSIISNNGYLSSPFQLSKGVRQVVLCLSPYTSYTLLTVKSSI